MKKKLSRMKKIRLKGWRGGSKSFIGSKVVRNSQIGQLLFYLVVLQLKRIQQYLEPSQQERRVWLPGEGPRSVQRTRKGM